MFLVNLGVHGGTNVSVAVTEQNVLVQEVNSSDSFDRIPFLDNPGALHTLHPDESSTDVLTSFHDEFI